MRVGRAGASGAARCCDLALSGQVSGRCPLAFPGASLLANSLRPRDTAGVPVSMRVRGHAPMRPRRDGVRGLRQALPRSQAKRREAERRKAQPTPRS
jgi:hypothetical protein